jgi:hypothetical protein
MKIVSRQEAIEQGLKKYFTGKPCKYGHISERTTHNWQCVQCKREFDRNNLKAKERTKQRYQENAEEIKRKRREKYAENREKEIHTTKEYQRKNRELVLAKKKQFHEKNRDRLIAECRDYYRQHKEQAAEFHKKYREANKALFREKGAKYRAVKIQATVIWANRSSISIFYKRADTLTQETNILHHVDHIVPLVSEYVCGLHNEFNLQVLTASENSSKSNKYWPDMPDTTDPELRHLVKLFKAKEKSQS